MNDITSQITDILNNPESMKKFSEMASSFLNSSEKNEKSQPTDSENFNFNPQQMGSIMKIMNILQKQIFKNDDNTKLLLALKPHLSAERSKKVDKAISLLKIVKVLPLLKDSGLEDLFGGGFFAWLFF